MLSPEQKNKLQFYANRYFNGNASELIRKRLDIFFRQREKAGIKPQGGIDG